MASNNYQLTGYSSAQDPRFASGSSEGAVSERENLANFISMITRDETPFMSDIGKTKAQGVYHEWQTDELVSPTNSRVRVGADFDHVFPDGTDGTENAAASYAGGTGFRNRTRLGNYTQINAKTVAVSGTKRAVDQAGVADEYAYQLKKRGVEMRRDIEHDLVNTVNVASAAVGASGAASMGTYRAWINGEIGTNTNGTCIFKESTLNIDNANVGEGSSVYTTTSTNLQAGESLELADIDAVMQAIYEEGGKATKLMMSPSLRRDFSSLAQAAGATVVGTPTNTAYTGNVRRNIDDDGRLRQSVDLYMSDFGEVMVVPNYIMGLSNAVTVGTDTSYQMANEAVFVYDPQWFSIATLRPMQEVDVGQRGDSTVGMFVEELTLEVRNPHGCGAIYGLGQAA